MRQIRLVCVGMGKEGERKANVCGGGGCRGRGFEQGIHTIMNNQTMH